MSILAFDDVHRTFHGTPALAGVTLHIDEPCVFGLIGRNGAGKSTLLRMIPCLLHPTAGSVRVFDMDPWAHQDEVKRRLGYLSEDDNWPAMVRPKDLIDVHAAMHKKWDRELERRLLERFKLDPRKRMRAMSKGQRRQVGLICAVCHYPDLLVLDEPAGGLDPVARRQFLQVVIDLLSDTGSTVLFSSHQFADVERLADRIAILHEGKLLADEQLSDLQESCCRAVVTAGEGTVNGQLAQRLAAEPMCLRVEAVGDDYLVTLRCSPDEAGELVRSRVGGLVREARAIDLEQLFIDWTGEMP